jgi:hypothetical protein
VLSAGGMAVCSNDTLLAAFWLGYLACLVSVGGTWWLLARVGGA